MLLQCDDFGTIPFLQLNEAPTHLTEPVENSHEDYFDGFYDIAKLCLITLLIKVQGKNTVQLCQTLFTIN